MKKIYCLYCLYCLYSFLIACSPKKQNAPSIADIDKVIAICETDRIKEFHNISIAVRQRTFLSTIYIVGNNDSAVPVYFVTLNNLTGQITEINNSFLKDAKISDYLTENQIAKYIKTIKSLDWKILAVDEKGNLFINPFYSNSPPNMLRKLPLSKINEKKLQGNFVQYKDHWYIDSLLLSNAKMNQ